MTMVLGHENIDLKYIVRFKNQNQPVSVKHCWCFAVFCVLDVGERRWRKRSMVAAAGKFAMSH